MKVFVLFILTLLFLVVGCSQEPKTNYYKIKSSFYKVSYSNTDKSSYIYRKYEFAHDTIREVSTWFKENGQLLPSIRRTTYLRRGDSIWTLKGSLKQPQRGDLAFIINQNDSCWISENPLFMELKYCNLGLANDGKIKVKVSSSADDGIDWLIQFNPDLTIHSKKHNTALISIEEEVQIDSLNVPEPVLHKLLESHNQFIISNEFKTMVIAEILANGSIITKASKKHLLISDSYLIPFIESTIINSKEEEFHFKNKVKYISKLLDENDTTFISSQINMNKDYSLANLQSKGYRTFKASGYLESGFSVQDFDSIINSKYDGDLRLIQISKPIFSSDRRKVFLQFNFGSSGASYVITRKGNTWNNTIEVEHWTE